MRTTDATREPGPPRSGVSRSEAGRGGDTSATGDLSQQLAQLEQRPSQSPLAGATDAELAKRAMRGDWRAREKLIEDCKPDILAEVAKQHRWLFRAGFDCWWDLYQEAHLAVLDALGRYDASRAGEEFRGYASYYIRKYVWVCAFKLARSESISIRLIQRMSLQAKREEQLNSTAGGASRDGAASRVQSRGESESKPADALIEGDETFTGFAEGGMSPESSECNGQRRLRAARLRPRPYSLDALIRAAHHDHFSNQTTLADRLVDENAPVPGEDTCLEVEKHCADNIPAEAVHAAVGDLDEYERIAVVGRYGLGTEGELGMKELARRLAISESALKELLSRARAKLSMALAVEMIAGESRSSLFEEADDHALARSA